MTGTLTIAERELRERSFVFVTAAVIALTPFMFATLRTTRTLGPRAAIIVIGSIAAVGMTLALAVVLGGSMVGGELSDRRMSFYFAKPVSASAIWFGKLAGAFVTVMLCFAITFLPSMLVAHDEWRTMWPVSIPRFIAGMIVLTMYLLLVSHAASTMVRSRSPLVAIDLALLVATVAAVWLIVRPLLVAFALELAANVVIAILCAVPLVMAAAGAWQLARGRTDIRANHRELSRFLWIGMAGVLIVAFGYVTWVLSAGPADLINRSGFASAREDWMLVSGDAKHRGDYRPIFLVNVTTKRSTRFGAGSLAAFNRAGNAVLTVLPSVELGHLQPSGELHVQTLDSLKQQTGTGIEVTQWTRIVVSDDLRRVAILGNQLLSVYDLSSHALLGSVRIPFGTNEQLFFPSPEVVRIYAYTTRGATTEPAELRVYEFDVAHRRLEETGRLSTVGRAILLRLSADGSTAVVNRVGAVEGPRMLIIDGRTASIRAAIAAGNPQLTFLASGGLTFVDVSKGVATLQLYDAAGHVVSSIALGPAVSAGAIREAVSGHKVIATVLRRAMNAQNPHGWDICVVDVQRGVVERVDRDLRLRTQFFSEDPRTPPAPEVAGDYVVSDSRNALWRWNALTGAKTKIF
ncbi:MAG: hypothetical protein NVSMB68_09610 [Thermoanaerobaculia bacterium]